MHSDWTTNDPTGVSYIKNRPPITYNRFTSNTKIVGDLGIGGKIIAESGNITGNLTVGGSIVGAIDYSQLTNVPSSSTFATVASTGAWSDLIGKPTIPAAQISSDWNQTTTSALDYIKNKPSIPSAQIQSDWAQATPLALDFIKNKPSFLTGITSTLITNALGFSPLRGAISVGGVISTTIDNVQAGILGNVNFLNNNGSSVANVGYDGTVTCTRVASLSPTSWISGTFGQSGVNTQVVVGAGVNSSTGAQIGGHNSALTAWTVLYVNNPVNTSFSDERVKENIVAADNQICYDSIKSLPLVRFNYNSNIVPGLITQDGTLTGILAQDLENVFPKSVYVMDSCSNTYATDGMKSINMDQVYYTMIGAVQKLMDIVETQQGKIDVLTSNVAALSYTG